MRLTGVLLLALLAVGCENPLGVEIPSGAILFKPPAEYYGWWDSLEEEAGMQGKILRVRWFSVPGGPFYSERSGAYVTGRWVSDGRIYLADNHKFNIRTVKHEMLHQLLGGDERHEHPLFSKY